MAYRKKERDKSPKANPTKGKESTPNNDDDKKSVGGKSDNSKIEKKSDSNKTDKDSKTAKAKK